jgi:exodeoxyribonuclease VII large subunit
MMNQHILQVSELTKKVRFLLESELNTVWLCGEISNFIAASSGHWYLSLKDSKSQVKCAMFKGNNRKVRLSTAGLPKNGQQVLVRARVSLYEPRGDFQLIIEQLEDAGEGILRQQFEQLKSRLHAEGLFDVHTKQPIPTQINTVGIITSPTGAAVKDILSVLKRRNPLINVIIYPTLVQGEDAKFAIVKAINTANDRKECDVLIVGRGGGSLEDLWCFNEEVVVRAINDSQLPTVSAVGHEIDTTLSDYAADHRAATPSAAAEIVSSDVKVHYNAINLLKSRIVQLKQRHLVDLNRQLSSVKQRLDLLHPAQKLHLQQQKTDELTIRLNNAFERKRINLLQQPLRLANRLLLQSPIKKIQVQQVQMAELEHRLTSAMLTLNNQKQAQFKHTIEQLNLVSPLATIARGYSVIKNKTGNVVTSKSQIKVDDELTIQLADGVALTKVTSVAK